MCSHPAGGENFEVLELSKDLISLLQHDLYLKKRDYPHKFSEFQESQNLRNLLRENSKSAKICEKSRKSAHLATLLWTLHKATSAVLYDQQIQFHS